MFKPRPIPGQGSMKARVKAPIVIFIPLFHSNALLGRTALLFTRVKAMFLPQTRPNVKTILFWLARNSFLLLDDGPCQGAGGFHLEPGLCDEMMDKTLSRRYYWRSLLNICTANSVHISWPRSAIMVTLHPISIKNKVFFFVFLIYMKFV